MKLTTVILGFALLGLTACGGITNTLSAIPGIGDTVATARGAVLRNAAPQFCKADGEYTYLFDVQGDGYSPEEEAAIKVLRDANCPDALAVE